MEEKNPLEGMFNSPRIEQPKCECGACVGLAVFDNRLWCSDCLWAEIEKLRAKLRGEE